MDDIIYILLGLAWIGLALYRNSQKKKLQKSRMEKQQQETEQVETTRGEKQGSLLEDILGQTEVSFFDEFEDEVSVDIDAPYNEPDKEKEPQPTAFEAEYDKRGIESVEELDAESAEKMFEELLEDQERVELHRIEGEEKEPFEFDLRKAVIYSEILNSRYF